MNTNVEWHTRLLPIITSNSMHLRMHRILEWARNVGWTNNDVDVGYTYITFKNEKDLSFFYLTFPDMIGRAKL